MLRKTVLILICIASLATPASFGAGVSWPLPDLGGLAGWKQAGSLATYNRDNLYEYIDGDAETYFGFGFSALAVGKFSDGAGKRSITLNLYEMTGPLSAFGIYANGRSAEVKFADVGAQGYIGENALDFWKGRFYVRVIGEGEPQGLENAVLAFGRSVAAKIEGSSGEPPETRLLPQAGQVKNSVKYQPQNVLGQGFISNGFIADYEVAGATEQLVVAQCKNDGEAAKALTGLRDYVKTSGAITEQAENSFFGNDPYYKNTLATTLGPYFVCVLRAPDRPTAQKLVDAFRAGLKP